MDVQTGPDQAGAARVVVGADGSPAALHAVRWAAAQARARGLDLEVLHAAPHVIDRAGPDGARVERVLGAAGAAARAAAPGVAVSTRPTSLRPVDALLAAAATARLVVVGAPVHGTSEVRTTSVALQVADRAACPVVVVRGPAAPAGGHVLVGVDDPEADIAALSTAFAEADELAGRVVVLHAQGGATRVLRRRAPDVAAARLAAVLDALALRHPRVGVEMRTPHRAAEDALLAAARSARLVVVGTRARGPAARALLGSHSHALLRRSPVPVLVVGPGARPPVAATAAAGAGGSR